MSTPSQIDANRRNSQKSTGPRTEQGKAASRFNALKTGIYAQSQMIPGEDPSDLETLAAEYHAEFQPTTPTRRDLVDALVCAQWELRRLRRVRAQLWHSQIADAAKRVLSKLNQTAPLGDVFDRGSTSFTLLGRRLDAADRAYYRALRELQRIQESGAPEPDPRADPDAQVPEDTPNLGSFRNIAPSLPVEPSCRPGAVEKIMNHQTYPFPSVTCTLQGQMAGNVFDPSPLATSERDDPAPETRLPHLQTRTDCPSSSFVSRRGADAAMLVPAA